MTRLLTLALVLVLSACTSPTDTLSGPSTAPVTVSLGDPSVDLLFEPLSWSPGDQIEVSDGRVRLASVASQNGSHRVRVDSERHVLSVSGVRDGAQVAHFPANRVGTVLAGQTEDPPTSIHRETVCSGGTCAEVIEYDYDLTTPDGQGETLWSPEEGESIRIDRLRVSLAEETGATQPLRITAPQELRPIR